ncbi:hypothetical protein AGLY_006010 [Aphis glycines]|uniref:SP-RING-type domain-containing protein n=1 Tax=Aphis glycines TaxID=307491 RepID=A0A6G0TSI4_APHGL|nr:hypothetical protein AGLY_006010 [Aphis glycines]
MSYPLPPNQEMSIIEQDALGLGTMASGNNSNTLSIETVSQIKYKNLPFYEVIDEVIKPTLLTGTNTCTLAQFPEGMKEAIFKVVLSSKQVNFVAGNRKISHGEFEYPYQYQIRICQFIEPVPNESPDYMPLGLRIRVNMRKCQLPLIPLNTRPELTLTYRLEYRRSANPIDCTEYVRLSPINCNDITINWIPDDKKYVFSMFLVKKLTTETLIKKLQDKGGRTIEETKNIIIKKLTNDDPELATTSTYRFSLLCPLGRTRMKIPAKSIHCDHLQCFDARIFILMNEKKPTWRCPTCNKPCLYNDLLVENYFLDIVSSPTLKDCTNEVEILPDGTWRMYEEIKKRKITDLSNS